MAINLYIRKRLGGKCDARDGETGEEYTLATDEGECVGWYRFVTVDGRRYATSPRHLVELVELEQVKVGDGSPLRVNTWYRTVGGSGVTCMFDGHKWRLWYPGAIGYGVDLAEWGSVDLQHLRP